MVASGGAGKGGLATERGFEPLGGSDRPLGGSGVSAEVQPGVLGDARPRRGRGLTGRRVRENGHGRTVRAEAWGTFQVQRRCDLSPGSVAAAMSQPR